MAEDLDRFDDLFAALSDPRRRRILDVLATKGEATATSLAGHVPVTRQAVAKHLGVLEAARLVQSRREGREVRYAVRPERVVATASWLSRLAREWEARLSAIRRIAEAEEPDGEGS